MSRARAPARWLAAVLVVAGAAVSNAAAADDAARLNEGRALYFGSQPFKTAARIAGAALPAAAGACVNCHGPLGRGSREGTQTAPDITTPRAGAPIDWLLALRGHDAAGRTLASAMPRYVFDADEAAALTAYAAVLGTPADPVRGVSDREILLGVRRAAGESAAMQRELIAGVERAAATANERGGVHGRLVRVVEVSTSELDPEIFARVASLVDDPAAVLADAAARRPDLASLAMFRDSVGRGGWTVPLFAPLREQAAMLEAVLVDAATLFNCEPWLLDPAGLRETSRGDAGVAASARRATFDDARSGTVPQRVCLGLIANVADGDSVLRLLRDRRVDVPLVVSLASIGTPRLIEPQTARRVVLPAPVAVAMAASKDDVGDGLWRVLGEASGRAAIEALARSGRLIQPELVLEAMRSMGGYEPVADAPLAFGRGRTHGWAPALDGEMPASSPTAIAGSDPPPRANR